MLNLLLILLGKLISKISKILNLGNGSTWPGHIALRCNKNFLQDITKASHTKIIIIAGTNGKTTTAKMISHILQENKKSVFQNTSGANLLNGITSAYILNTNLFGKITKEYAVFEVDENALPLILHEVTPHAVILLNLFRDQLDRYGEIDSIVKKWKKALMLLPPTTSLYLNTDDPEIAYLAKDLVVTPMYYGLEERTNNTTLQHAADSIYCPNCHTKLTYQSVYYSHLGIWRCQNCTLKRPKPFISTSYYPLAGTYNKYNTLAAVLFTQQEGISEKDITKALQTITPAFGRQETIQIEGKKVQIFLAKNPTSFNQSLETIQQLRGKQVLFVLNDRIPDGRDVSWIWDVDFENYINYFDHIIISGDRVFDMALRIEYTQPNPKSKIQNPNEKVHMFEDVDKAVKQSLQLVKQNETLYILPTYSAMLEVRKILTGKKIL